MDMLETNNFGKYLGFPFKHKGAMRGQFNFVADWVMKKLAGWKTKFFILCGKGSFDEVCDVSYT